MCFVNLCLRLYFGFLDCLVYDLLCSDFCVTELSFIAFFQLFSICSVVCGRIQIIFNVLLAFVQHFNDRFVAEMAQNGNKDEEVNDLNQQCTVNVYQ